jgi:hypothetical protein
MLDKKRAKHYLSQLEDLHLNPDMYTHDERNSIIYESKVFFSEIELDDEQLMEYLQNFHYEYIITKNYKEFHNFIERLMESVPS